MVTFTARHQVEQYGVNVFVSIQYRQGGSWHGTDLQHSWFGHHLGFTAPFEDEESAHFAATALVEFLKGQA